MPRHGTDDPFGVSAKARILTCDGWRQLSQVVPGTPLTHPAGAWSELVATMPIGDVALATVTMADGSQFTVTEDQPLRVELGTGVRATAHSMTPRLIHDALLRGRTVRLPRHGPYAYGSEQVP